jgi:hypothetical protein
MDVTEFAGDHCMAAACQWDDRTKRVALRSDEYSWCLGQLKMNYVLKILRKSLTALLFLAMCVTALLIVSVGVVVGGVFELGKAISHPMAKYGKTVPVVIADLDR